jgi:acetyl-CoA acetyltransferase
MHSASIRDRAAIVGIGQTAFAKRSGITEQRAAVEAIQAALENAGRAQWTS